MNLQDITPVILCLDEAPNIGRTLAALQWASDVVVLDSGSSDRTEEIARAFPNVRWFVRAFDSHAAQWNHALTLARTPWVLTLDADYQLNPSFRTELEMLDADSGSVWYAPFRYLVLGAAVRGAILPPRAVLFRTVDAHYIDDGHTQLLVHTIPRANLRTPIDHDDRKSLSRWLRSQIRYSELEARKLAGSTRSELGFADRIRIRVWLAPVLVFLHVWLFRGAWLSGWRGWIYAGQRALAELMLSLYLAEKRVSKIHDKPD